MARMAPTRPPAATRSPGLHVVDGRILAVCGDGEAIEIRELLAHGAPLAPESLRALVAGQQHEGSSR